jgi:hypothetical protein
LLDDAQEEIIEFIVQWVALLLQFEPPKERSPYQRSLLFLPEHKPEIVLDEDGFPVEEVVEKGEIKHVLLGVQGQDDRSLGPVARISRAWVNPARR